MVFCRDSILSISDIEFLEEEKEIEATSENLEVKLENIIKKFVQLNNFRELERKIEKIIIKTVLEETKYNISKSAQILGITRSTLRKKINEMNIILNK